MNCWLAVLRKPIELLASRAKEADELLASRAKEADELERLDKAVEGSSEKNRNFFIAYLGLLIYVQSIVFSTTDLQLLVFTTEGLKLPLIDLPVPLVWFYGVVPIFIIALHFNFLQNLESHHYKLMRWQDAHGGEVPRRWLHPFLFDYAILERSGQFYRWVQAANSLLCYNFAPITLGLLLIRYSDRQDPSVTVWHFLAFVFDVYLVWKLRFALLENAKTEQSPIATKNWLFLLVCFCIGILRHGLMWAFVMLLLVETSLTGLIAWTDNKWFVENEIPLVEPIRFVQQLPDMIKNDEPDFPILGFVAVKYLTRPFSWLIPRIEIEPTQTVWNPNTKELEAAFQLAGYKDWAQYFNEKGEGFLPTIESLRLLLIYGAKAYYERNSMAANYKEPSWWKRNCRVLI